MSGPLRIVRRAVDAVPPELAASLHPVLARVYAARHVGDPGELTYGLDGLPGFEALADIDAAVDLLVDAIDRGTRILVVGDFDADGATSTALALRALRALGARQVDFLVPNRFEYGYGLTPEIVAAAEPRRPELIVTVDNGVSSVEGVAAAKARGWRVLVTDHHLPGAVLPAADAIVNPNRPDCRFPSKALAGVGVIFYVMLALRARLRDAGRFTDRREPNLGALLDLVALGTVADVVPLDHVNRTLVAQGLARIRRGACVAGVRALLDVAGRSRERTVASDLGFAVGPRLNAAGRLDDMSVGIRCLLSDDDAQARELAVRLDGLNRERREIETEMQEQARQALDDMALEQEAGTLPAGLCLYRPDWHPGVVGIVASRIKERWHRPVIVFADADAGMIKGSARSVRGVHIRDALDAVAVRHPGLIERFGGHAMAAGLTLPRANLDTFAEAFEAEVERHLDAEDLNGVVHSDGPLGPGDTSLELAEAVRFGGPWGQGFAEPVFDGSFRVISWRVVGERHLKLVLRSEHGESLDAIAFNFDAEAWGAGCECIHAAYRLDVNLFRGERSTQLIVEALQAATEAV